MIVILTNVSEKYLYLEIGYNYFYFYDQHENHEILMTDMFPIFGHVKFIKGSSSMKGNRKHKTISTF